jgi:hypothetical protein
VCVVGHRRPLHSRGDAQTDAGAGWGAVNGLGCVLGADKAGTHRRAGYRARAVCAGDRRRGTAGSETDDGTYTTLNYVWNS